MELWENGKLDDLIREGKTLQQRLSQTQQQENNSDLVKKFRNHIIRGNLSAAIRLLDKNSCKGILPMTEETIKQLHEKHPKGESKKPEMILEGPMEEVNPVIFEEINAELVKTIALKMKGAAGPSGFDSED